MDPALKFLEEDLELMNQIIHPQETQSKEPTDSDYDTDIEIPEPVKTPYDQWGKRTYLRVCRKLKMTPITSVLRDLATDRIELMHRGLSEGQIIAITTCLLDNAAVKMLNFEGNPLSPKAFHYLYLGMKENLNIEALNLRNTSVSHQCTPVIATLLIRNDNLKRVNLSDNNFGDEDIKYLERVIEKNKSIEHLDLSHNNFGGESSPHFSHTIASNDTLRSLDLSWNLFKAKDAMHICRGLQENVKISTLNLGMNGITNKGVQYVMEMLKTNVTLTDLDLTCNRISDKGAYLLGKALQQNETLRSLKLSKNPLTNLGVMAVMNGMLKNESCGLRYLNIVSVSIFQSAIDLYTQVRELHSAFKLIHGQVVDDVAPTETPRVQEEADTDDPMHILKYHLIAKRRKLIHYFRSQRIGGDGLIGKEDFKEGLKAVKIPLTNTDINRLEQILEEKHGDSTNFAPLILKPGQVIDLPPELPESSEEEGRDDDIERPSGPEKQSFIEEKKGPNV